MNEQCALGATDQKTTRPEGTPAGTRMMPTIEPFEKPTDRYDRWFETYDHASRPEIRTLGRLVSVDADDYDGG